MGTSWVYGERDYRAIQEALLRSDYGRWFLGEYLARNRSAETQRLLEALERLEASLSESETSAPLPRLREIALEIDAALGEALRQAEDGAAAPDGEPPVDAILEAVEDINDFLALSAVRHVQHRLPEKVRIRLADIQGSCAQVDKTSSAAGTLMGVLGDLRRRLSTVGAELELAETGADDGRDPRVPRKLLDELAAALSPYAEAPAGS